MNKKPPRNPEDAFHQYDLALDEIIAGAFFRLFGAPSVRLFKLKTAYKKYQEKRADMLMMSVDPATGKESVVHIEIQTSDDENMIFRMLHYFSLIYKENRMDIVQYVVYAGDRPPKMETSAPMPDHNFTFRLVYLKEIDGEPFLESSIPEEVILALLCKFPEGQEAHAVVRRIVDKITKLEGHDPESLKKRFAQLKIISQLRNLQDKTDHQDRIRHAAFL